MLKLRDGTRKKWQAYSFTRTCTKPTQGGYCIVGALLVLEQTTSNPDTQDSPRPKLGGSHHLLPYSILCASPRGPNPNGFLSWDSQVGVLKLQQLGLSQLWGCIISYANLWSWWGLKQSCNLCPKLSNNISHVTYTQGNRVGSQTANLTLGLSFGHNLCYRCSNEQCKPILDIYTSIVFQWYKKLFKARSFDPYNHALEIRESIRDSNSQHGSSLVSVRVHSLTLFALSGACEVTIGSPSWPRTLQPIALVTSPSLGLRHKIMNFIVSQNMNRS